MTSTALENNLEGFAHEPVPKYCLKLNYYGGWKREQRNKGNQQIKFQNSKSIKTQFNAVNSV